MALVLLVALQLTGSDGSTSAPSAADPSGTTPTGPAGSESTPPSTTSGTSRAFFDREPVLPANTFDYEHVLPPHFDDVAVVESSPVDNPVTDEGATLGRVLFYDVNLSRNRTVRCASCHVQVNGFADPLTLSQGVDGFRTRRNSMSLANAAFNPSGRYLWDEAAETLEAQVLLPFEDQLEMDLPLPGVIARIEERDYYEPLFVSAFGDATVTSERISAALAQFVRAMISADSAYDVGRAGVASPLEPFANFTEEENRGKELFFSDRRSGGAGCSGCHQGEAQINGRRLENNGIDPPTAIRQAADLGGFEVSGDLAQLGSFRVPSLRNVEVTGPYMHDGRFTSLEAVIDHYSEGLQPHENLSPQLRGGAGQPIDTPFTTEQKNDLRAFLATLTDDSFLTDERFSEPFRSAS